VDAIAYAAVGKAHSAAAEAQSVVPTLQIPTDAGIDRKDQSDPARLGKLLLGWALESVLVVRPKLGGTEDSAPPGASPIASRLRLEAVE
jgi:hypothetical protein